MGRKLLDSVHTPNMADYVGSKILSFQKKNIVVESQPKAPQARRKQEQHRQVCGADMEVISLIEVESRMELHGRHCYIRFFFTLCAD